MRSALPILFVLLTGLAFAQKFTEPDKMKTFNIVVNYDTYTVKTQMLKDIKKIRVLDDRTYMWCSANKIFETRAGYDGKLLHGYYKSFYFENSQLRESGKINYGLKTGEWRYWYADGRLKEIITYKKGSKNGKYELYNDYGKRMASGRFKNDLLHGHFYTYNNQGTVEAKKTYRHGMEVLPTVKPAKVKKQRPDTVAKKEKKLKKAKEKKEPAAAPEKKKKEKKSASKQQGDTLDQPAQKKSFGQKVKELFKKKEKKSGEPEHKPVSNTV